MKTIGKIITLLIVITFLIPHAHAFGFSIFKFIEKQPIQEICAPNTGLDNIIDRYNETYVSRKIFSFLDNNNYRTISLTVKENTCVHEYTIEITDSGQAIITEGHLDNASLRVSTTYGNMHFAEEAYRKNDILGLIKSSFMVKMPLSTRIKVVLFLKSYI
ncbi:MAG: hypothetical protein U9Q92_05175 [archaeon]|nr:hypothetical protein [archaeon]